MRVRHNSDIHFLSIDFKDEVEAKSEYHEGIIVRYDKKGNVIGVDITDSIKLFSSTDTVSLQEACQILGVSESTLRRKIRDGKIKFSKAGREYRFKKADELPLEIFSHADMLSRSLLYIFFILPFFFSEDFVF